MTFIIPSALSVPAPTLQWSTTALSTTDDVGSYTIYLSFGSNTSNTKIVNIQVDAGTATYFDGSTSKAADWVIDTASPIDSNGIVQIVVPGGFQTWPVTIRVNENLHSSETQIATITNGQGYRLASSQLTHTATVAIGFTKPTAANTGYGTTQLSTYTGTSDLDAGQYDSLIFTGGSYTPSRGNIDFYNCWFKPTGLGTNADSNGYDYLIRFYQQYSGIRFFNCEFGNNDSVGNTSYSAHFFAHFYNNIRNVHMENCHFHDAGWDHIKLNGGGWRLRNCFFEKVGTSVPWYIGPKPAHGDILQKDKGGGTGWETYDVDVYRCNLYLPVSVGDAGGYSYNSPFQVDWNGNTDQNIQTRDISFRSNWMIGGNDTLSNSELQQGQVENCSITNCRLGTRKDTDYRNAIIDDLSGRWRIAGCISDHDEDMTPLDDHGNPVNNATAF